MFIGSEEVMESLLTLLTLPSLPPYSLQLLLQTIPALGPH